MEVAYRTSRKKPESQRLSFIITLRVKEICLSFLQGKRLRRFFPPCRRDEKRSQTQKERLIFLVDFVLGELRSKTEKLRFINMLYLTEDGVAAIHEAMQKYEEQFAKIFQMERQLFLELGFSDPDMEATYMRSILQGISLEYMLGPSDYPLEGIRKRVLSRYITEGNG